MTIKAELFDYLDRFGATITVGELHAEGQRADAVALRHDIDHDLDLALELAHHEHARGLRASYFLLHTHEYWNDPMFLEKCQQLAAYGHEVGLHANALTAWMTGEVDDVGDTLNTALARLRESGVTITGVSSHGDRACYEHGFSNIWAWGELRGDDPVHDERGRAAEGVHVDDPAWQIAYPPDHAITRSDGARFELWSVPMGPAGIAYDAIHVPHDHYWSDTGGSWSRTGDPRGADFSHGRHQVLVHPIWWRGTPRTVFVLSTARAGSKWLANFVETATSATGKHEWTLNHQREGDAFTPSKRTHDDFQTLIDRRAIAASLIRQMAAWRPHMAGDLLEANVYLEPFIEELREWLPEAVLLHLHRDGRDVVRSILNRGWYDTPDDRRHRIAPTADWLGLTRFERACWYYRFTNERLLEHCDRRLAFETMIADRAALEQTLESLDIVTHPLLADRHFDRVVNANIVDDVPPYDAWSALFRDTFDDLCGAVQSELGYQTLDPARSRAIGDAPAASPLPTRVTALESIPWLPQIRRRLPRPWGSLVVEIAGAGIPTPRGDSRGVTTRSTEQGLELCTTEVATNAHCVLTSGAWSKIKPKQGIRAPRGSYYRGEIASAAAPGTAARLFVLYYGSTGALVGKRHIATFRSDVPVQPISFVAPDDASYIGLAVHLAGLTPEQVLVIERLVLHAVPLPSEYGAVPAIASASPTAPRG